MEFAFPFGSSRTLLLTRPVKPARLATDSDPMFSMDRQLAAGERSAGFTLIELLVVMLMLGILAAIALPAFFNQSEKAGDAKAKEYAHSAEVAIETYATENNGSFKKATVAQLEAIEPTLANASITVPTAQETKYKITSTADTGHEFTIENNAGTLSFTCKPKSSGGCPANKQWGE